MIIDVDAQRVIQHMSVTIRSDRSVTLYFGLRPEGREPEAEGAPDGPITPAGTGGPVIAESGPCGAFPILRSIMTNQPAKEVPA